MGYIYSPFLYDEKPREREELAMTNTVNIDAILDKVRERRGIPTKQEQARKRAVNDLLGRTERAPLRPEAQALADSIRKGR